MSTAQRVVVVGAGVMGSWTARWLRTRGSAVTLLDAYGAGNALSSSGDESRVTRSAHGPDSFYPRWQRAALAAWRELEAELRQRLFVPTGVLWLAHERDGPEADSLRTLSALDIPAERLTVEDVADRYPQLTTGDLGWALFEPEAGVLLARRAVAAVAAAVAAAGGDVRTAAVAPPLATDAGSGRLRHVRLGDGSLEAADAFVFAAGPWLPNLFPQLFDAAQLTVTRQEVLYLAPPAGDARFDAGTLPTWVDHRAAVYGLPSIEGRGMKVAPDWPGERIDPDRMERRVSDASIASVRAFLRVRMPAMADQPVVEGRVCQYASTPDTHFVIDRHPEWENAWILGGGSGHAFKHGPRIGELAAALVSGDRAAIGRLEPADQRFALRERTPSPGMRTSAAGPSGLPAG
jgi:glycine/D-amino acid oxidase-like deaminating enzyme